MERSPAFKEKNKEKQNSAPVALVARVEDRAPPASDLRDARRREQYRLREAEPRGLGGDVGVAGAAVLGEVPESGAANFCRIFCVRLCFVLVEQEEEAGVKEGWKVSFFLLLFDEENTRPRPTHTPKRGGRGGGGLRTTAQRGPASPAPGPPALSISPWL